MNAKHNYDEFADELLFSGIKLKGKLEYIELVKGEIHHEHGQNDWGTTINESIVLVLYNSEK